LLIWSSTSITHSLVCKKYYTIIVFCWGQCEFVWTLKTIFTEAFRLRWILISN
jgi:hypothetical protein